MAKSRIVIATRGSKLALWQSEHVKAKLEAAHAGLEVELKVISTKGDRIQAVSLSKIGDKGLFTQELESALRSGEADIAVHSLKDLPTQLDDDLKVLAMLEREDHRDLLISTAPIEGGLSALAQGARLGTSSLRRRAQAAAIRPDLNISDIRGNVDTRLDKLRQGQHDAIILAAAGVLRLGFVKNQDGLIPGDAMQGLSVAPLESNGWISAVGQGVIGIEGRADDSEVSALMAALHDDNAACAAKAERAFMRTLEGGCQTPVAAHAHQDDQGWTLTGGVYSLDGSQVIRNSLRFEASKAVESGEALAQQALSEGAANLLNAARDSNA